MAPSATSVVVLGITMAVVLCCPPAMAENDVNTLRNPRSMQTFIRSSCRSTLYPRFCVSTLSPYAGYLRSAKPSELARVAVSVSLANCRNVSLWTQRLCTNAALRMTERERMALKDCKENLGDSLDQLRQSLGVLNQLKSDSFKFQMSDVETYMSAALTNEDSCLDGFQGASSTSRVKGMVQPRISKLARLISNALALVNRCASSGGY